MKDLHIVEGSSSKSFEKSIEQEMDKKIRHFEKELDKLRTGRANPNMIEDLKIDAYGNLMSLKEISAISAPEAQVLTIQPWDKSLIKTIEKTIINSDLNLNPRNNGNVIHIQLPMMTQERRKELIKVLHQKLENTKISLRNVRKDILNFIRDKNKNKEISEDYSKKLQDDLQKIVNNYISKAEKISSKKEQEIKG